jgi:hypothetical protein
LDKWSWLRGEGRREEAALPICAEQLTRSLASKKGFLHTPPMQCNRCHNVGWSISTEEERLSVGGESRKPVFAKMQRRRAGSPCCRVSSDRLIVDGLRILRDQPSRSRLVPVRWARVHGHTVTHTHTHSHSHARVLAPVPRLCSMQQQPASYGLFGGQARDSGTGR